MSDVDQKRALITGLSGFTGRYMAAELRALGYLICGIGESSTEGLSIKADLTDLLSLQAAIAQIKPHVVVHLAGIAFVGHSQPSAFYEVNLIGTRNLLQALEPYANQLECVLLASSANVYGNAQEGLIAETHPPNPSNDYAVSKLAMEFMAKTWMPKLPIVIARPFNYTGIGQTDNFLIPKIVSHFLRQEKSINLGNLEVWREFNDVRDVVSAYRELLLKKPLGKTFNVCSGNLISLREVMSLASDITGHQIEINVNPAFVRANEVTRLGGDCTQLTQLFTNWDPRPLSDTLAWMLNK
ncbi:GDP-mannose 4,6-dehydratase [Zwartia vadi]|uniref:GDP-mannose 4,6-dehydratase n=1 Tax=Zwartia vadi TaxID=3058168 RepID=UPI0025B51C26|nr:GDP-mannose 4,6-dehydratase [Zwartia vadi]MDN3988218.1 GDP-mannose 4,6-dehydratase [Zwartia vadi]